MSLDMVTSLVGPAFTIAMLGAMESLLSAVVADGMIGSRHRSNMELVAQGTANVIVPFFGGIPSTGAIARTATNVRNGGRTPVAGIVHALTLLTVTLVAAQWASHIPLATLGAILMVVAYHMSEWRTFMSELRAPGSDIAVLLATFLLTVLVDLTVAIEVGMVLAAFLFIRRMAGAVTVTAIAGAPGDEEGGDDEVDAAAPRQVPPGVHVFEITGAFFFGAVEAFKETVSRIATTPQVLILRMRHVSVLDSSAIHALRDVVRRSKQEGTAVLLSEVQGQPLDAITGAGLAAELGSERLFTDLESALLYARDCVARAPGAGGELPHP